MTGWAARRFVSVGKHIPGRAGMPNSFCSDHTVTKVINSMVFGPAVTVCECAFNHSPAQLPFKRAISMYKKWSAAHILRGGWFMTINSIGWRQETFVNIFVHGTSRSVHHNA